MATYCFRCTLCDETLSAPTTDITTFPLQGVDFHHWVRDYRAENVGVSVVNLQREREAGGKEGLKRLFLPHNDDYKGPGDPDGTKGMRKWREENQPAASNKNPAWPGFVDKKTF